MALWMNLGEQFKMNAIKFPKLIALKDKNRTFTYSETNERVNRLSIALLDLGLSKGDKIAALLENCIELVELYLATAKTGIILIPINFRLIGKEISYIVNNSDAKAIFFDTDFSNVISKNKKNIPKVNNYITIGKKTNSFINYDMLIKKSKNYEPNIEIIPKDTWIIIYTSGTTGKPKGVVRSHESHIAFYLINAIDFNFTQDDFCMNVMPLCHINSVFFTFIFLYIGASVYIHPARLFNPEEILKIIEKENITFISLIPTHYNLILNQTLSPATYNLSSINKLLCSSATVRKNMKLAIMDFFPNAKLYEAYGSSEAGIVTILKPEDQISKLGSIGYESLGTDKVKIINQDGSEILGLDIGEIYSKGPMLFDCYYKMPKETKKSFIGKWFSAGDMGYKDKDGFYKIVDRKDNMIITGGEHVYPSAVEEIINDHPNVLDAAVIGMKDDKWGEKVVAVIVPIKYHDKLKQDIKLWCKKKLANYKCPKNIIFIKQNEMPKTATGKILHRILRDRFKIDKT